MAATTISRATITDGTTVFNAAQVGTDIYDPIDALFTSAFTFGALVHSEGFGTHLWKTGGTGGNIFNVVNTTAGTGNFAQFQLGHDADDAAAVFVVLSTTWTTDNENVQDGASLTGLKPGGLSIAAKHASGELRLYSNGVSQGPAITVDSLVTKFGGPLVMDNIVSPAQITGNVNDYSPSGLSTANFLRLDSDGAYSITGLDSTGVVDGQLLLFYNVGSNNLTIVNESASSAAANRFSFTGTGILNANEGLVMIYDGTSSRWRKFAII